MDQLPIDVLHKVLVFVGNGKDFRSFEKSCRTFHRALKDDGLWGSCEECKPKYQNQLKNWPTSNRERALLVRALHQCHQWQRSTESAIASVVGVLGWKKIVEMAKLKHFPHDLTDCRHFFPLRGDTSAVLLSLVEDCVVTQLQRTHAIVNYAATRLEDSPQPLSVSGSSVSGSDFVFQDFLHGFSAQHRWQLVPSPEQQAQYNIHVQEFDTSKELQRQIVRRLTYRAGIPKFQDDLPDLVWETLLHVCALLLRPPAMRLADRPLPKPGARRILQASESVRDTSPLPEVGGLVCGHCGKNRVRHWIVPKQVEDAAKDLGIDSRAYGDEWHTQDLDGSSWTRAVERAFAESKYSFLDKADDLVPRQKINKRVEDLGVAANHAGSLEDDESYITCIEDATSDDEAWVLDPIRTRKTIISRTEQGDDTEEEEEYVDDGGSIDDNLDVYVDRAVDDEVLFQDFNRICSQDYVAVTAFDLEFRQRVYE